MPKDPWQRANELSRLQAQKQRPRAALGRPQGRSSGPLLALVILLLLALLGTLGWIYREQLAPRIYHSPVPEPIREAAHKLDRQEPDLMALDKGFDIDLVMMDDYHRVMEATILWKIDWKRVVLGGNHQRLEANGIRISIENNLIRGYELDIPAIFADSKWQPLQKQLQDAGFWPEQRYMDILGDPEAKGTELWLHRSQPLGMPQADEHAAYRLRFRDGRLVELLGAIGVGNARENFAVWDSFVPGGDQQAAAAAGEFSGGRRPTEDAEPADR